MPKSLKAAKKLIDYFFVQRLDNANRILPMKGNPHEHP